MNSFNMVDTLPVRAVVGSHPAEYHLCTLTPLKSCDRSVDEVFVVVSEPVELDRRRFGVLALVSDYRTSSSVQRYYLAYLHPRGGEWRVVSFQRMN